MLHHYYHYMIPLISIHIHHSDMVNFIDYGKSHQNPMENHHFPMVFLWFSHVKFTDLSEKHPGLGIESSPMPGTERCGKSCRCHSRCLGEDNFCCFIVFSCWKKTQSWCVLNVFLVIYFHGTWCFCLLIYHLWFMIYWWRVMAVYAALMMTYDCLWWFCSYEYVRQNDADLDNVDVCFVIFLLLTLVWFTVRQRTGKA